jgi:hypothetical protein
MNGIKLECVLINVLAELSDIFILNVDETPMEIVFGIMGIVAWSVLCGAVGYYVGKRVTKEKERQKQVQQKQSEQAQKAA